MSDLYLNRLTTPIVTGTPQITSPGTTQTQRPAAQPERSFDSVLQEQIGRAGLEFSKHAATRVAQRNIPLSQNSLERLNEGVRLAKAKGLNDTLIMVDNTAFIVSAQNGKVITTVGKDDLHGNVFTNIDGTVII